MSNKKQLRATPDVCFEMTEETYKEYCNLISRQVTSAMQKAIEGTTKSMLILNEISHGR